MLKKVRSCGLRFTEIGTGAYPGNAHGHPEQLLTQPGHIEEYRRMVGICGIAIIALACQGNSLPPAREIANRRMVAA